MARPLLPRQQLEMAYIGAAYDLWVRPTRIRSRLDLPQALRENLIGSRFPDLYIRDLLRLVRRLVVDVSRIEDQLFSISFASIESSLPLLLVPPLALLPFRRGTLKFLLILARYPRGTLRPSTILLKQVTPLDFVF